MPRFSISLRALAACCAAFALMACGADNEEKAPGTTNVTIAIDGSSTVFPLSEAAAEAFSNSAPAAPRVTVGESGTGGGFRKFCRGEIQISDASRPISGEEIAACTAANITYVEIPIAFDGVTVVTHPSNTVSNVTLAQLKTIWEPAAQGRITRWNQVSPSWPATALQLYGPGTASGTFDFFTEAVVGEEGSSRTDFTPSEDDNVIVQGVSRNEGGLGYFGYAYFEANQQRLKALSIEGVAPSPTTIADGTYRLARPMFIYVNANELRRPPVQRFVQYYIANAATLAPQVGYVPLPASAYEIYATRVREVHTGTAFGGHQAIGVSIADVIARPLSNEAAPAQ